MLVTYLLTLWHEEVRSVIRNVIPVNEFIFFIRITFNLFQGKKLNQFQVFNGVVV